MEEKGFLEEPTWAARAMRMEWRLLSPHEPKTGSVTHDAHNLQSTVTNVLFDH